MPLLVLKENTKKDIVLLTKLPEKVLLEFVKISLEFVKKGANKKKYAPAANMLKVEVAVVERAVEAMAFVLIESSKRLLPPRDFIDSLTLLSFKPEICQAINQIYLRERQEIRALLKERSFALPQYESLRWRLDIQIGSRSLQNSVPLPVYILKLSLANAQPGGAPQTIFLEADYANLKNITQKLEQALNAMKTAHVRRVMRNIQ
mmetsp:Transcript_20762/g.30904  ORF Transcript_20762/g.30904 Transcript_20762/m.30904 type:complete len:205 (-) Transcript_20762:76-690(-)|eukprot:CAMPEP_0201546240 /NCGR_PEP_ID=MMETSP0173_2-20130828/2586_1 /ASSEMBLY_ACC=CAM_ASM_000268 /TAXON_ID=218659 /ORGANISM="Vexillifera sp., Strain DIVA3 564/2" /LENGTH=204 /DNA_ID=CAMNT_0047954847 /DNA_START=44 /DNA_END=658 /DNA_ORIENTATION=+